jgi:pimeloyl-ACP methyl ester carboxylesterase
MKRRLDAAKVGQEFVDWYANEMGKTPVHVVVQTHDALVGNDLSDVLRRIKVPTLLLSADSRPGYTKEYVREMEQLIPGAKLVVFPGTFGFVHHSEPEMCAQTLLAFLAKRVPDA